MGAGRSARIHAKTEVIFSQSSPADAVFYIRKGKVKLTVVSSRGKQAVIAILGIGDFFGEGCLAGQSVRRSTASAISDCSLVRMERTAAATVIRDEPAFSKLFIRHLLSRNLRIEEDLVDQLFNSTEKRLARVLLLLANFGKKGKPEPVIPAMSFETLAEIVGTTPARVSLFMKRFQTLGFVGHEGGLQVRSSLLNIVLRD